MVFFPLLTLGQKGTDAEITDGHLGPAVITKEEITRFYIPVHDAAVMAELEPNIDLAYQVFYFGFGRKRGVVDTAAAAVFENFVEASRPGTEPPQAYETGVVQIEQAVQNLFLRRQIGFVKFEGDLLRGLQVDAQKNPRLARLLAQRPLVHPVSPVHDLARTQDGGGPIPCPVRSGDQTVGDSLIPAGVFRTGTTPIRNQAVRDRFHAARCRPRAGQAVGYPFFPAGQAVGDSTGPGITRRHDCSHGKTMRNNCVVRIPAWPYPECRASAAHQPDPKRDIGHDQFIAVSYGYPFSGSQAPAVDTGGIQGVGQGGHQPDVVKMKAAMMSGNVIEVRNVAHLNLGPAGGMGLADRIAVFYLKGLVGGQAFQIKSGVRFGLCRLPMRGRQLDFNFRQIFLDGLPRGSGRGTGRTMPRKWPQAKQAFSASGLWRPHLGQILIYSDILHSVNSNAG